MNLRVLPVLGMLALVAFARADDTPVKMRVLQDHGGSVMSLSFSPAHARLATSSRDGTIKIWDLASAKLDRTLQQHTDDVYCVTYSPDGALLASGSGDKTIRIWDAKTFDVIRTLDGHTEVVRWVSFSPDGKTLASASGDLTIRLWDVATGKEIKRLEGHASVVKMVRFTPDVRTLVSTGADGTVRTWDLDTGRERALLQGHTSSIEGIAISPDGKLLASSSNDATVRVWDAETGAPIHLLLGHVGEVDSVGFMPDSRTVISGGKDKTIRFWDAHSGKLLRTLTGHTGRVESLELSGDGRTLASGGGGGDTSVRIWDLSNLALPRDDSPRPPAVAGEASQRGARPTRQFDPAEIDQLWRLLGNDDGDDVGVAMQRLVSGGDKAVAALARRLTPTGTSPADIDRMIAQLQSPDPHVRERATCDLIAAGDAAAEAPIREALKRNPSPQVQHRLEMALRDLTTREPGAKLSAAAVLRAANVVKALHDIGTPAARQLLVTLSKGDRQSELARQAQEALGRQTP
jgi:tricorn protease-like protein